MPEGQLEDDRLAGRDELGVDRPLLPDEQLQRTERWEESGQLLSRAAAALERAGAELLVLCTNTMHVVAAQIEAAISIPLLHIADATADRLRASDIASAGLIGTRFTMEKPFYRERLERRGFKVLVPPEPDREVVHRIIYEELCRGIIRDASRSVYERVVSDLVARGCQGVVLGCTEIGLLLGASQASVPLFDTAQIHAEAAAHHALAEGLGSAHGS